MFRILGLLPLNSNQTASLVETHTFHNDFWCNYHYLKYVRNSNAILYMVRDILILQFAAYIFGLKTFHCKLIYLLKNYELNIIFKI